MGKKHIRHNDYNQIKALLNSGVSHRQIAEITGRGMPAVALIARAGSLAEYRRLSSERSRKYRGGVNKVDGITETKDIKVKRPYLKEGQFTQIKILLGAGLSHKQTALAVGRSPITVSKVASVENWPEYKAKLAEELAKRKAATYQPTTEPVTEPIAESVGEPIAQQLPPSEYLLLEAMVANTTALNDLALAWNQLSEKLGEVIETKRPWLARVKN